MKQEKIPQYLIRYCQSCAPVPYRPYIEPAMRSIHEWDPQVDFSDRKTMEGVLRVALHLSLSDKPGPYSRETARIELSPENLIRSDEALKRLRPGLERLRRRVFNRADPPYRVDEKACAPAALIAKLLGPTGRLGETTCFSQDSLLVFILMGVKPIARAFSIRFELMLPPIKDRPTPITHDLLIGRARSAEVKLYRPLSDRELPVLAKELRRMMRPSRKSLTGRHRRLYEFFEEYGQPPLSGKMQFWRDAFAKWKREFPDDEINTYLSLRIARLRLQSLLKRS